MNTKYIITLALGASLALVQSSVAAPRNWSKATGNYDDSMSHRPTASAQRSYRAAPPSASQEASQAVASAPSTSRRFSYEPSTANKHADSAQAAAKPKASAKGTTKSAQATRSTRSTRRYSYEPSTRVNGSQRMQNSRAFINSLPKSDPRRYNF